MTESMKGGGVCPGSGELSSHVYFAEWIFSGGHTLNTPPYVGSKGPHAFSHCMHNIAETQRKSKKAETSLLNKVKGKIFLLSSTSELRGETNFEKKIFIVFINSRQSFLEYCTWLEETDSSFHIFFVCKNFEAEFLLNNGWERNAVAVYFIEPFVFKYFSFLPIEYLFANRI